MATGKNAVNYEAAADVDGIPVVWIQPDNQDGDARIVLWLPWLTGTKETALAHRVPPGRPRGLPYIQHRPRAEFIAELAGREGFQRS